MCRCDERVKSGDSSVESAARGGLPMFNVCKLCVMAALYALYFPVQTAAPDPNIKPVVCKGMKAKSALAGGALYETDGSEDCFDENYAPHNGYCDAQQSTDQKIFCEAFGFEFGVAGDGLGR